MDNVAPVVLFAVNPVHAYSARSMTAIPSISLPHVVYMHVTPIANVAQNAMEIISATIVKNATIAMIAYAAKNAGNFRCAYSKNVAVTSNANANVATIADPTHVNANAQALTKMVINASCTMVDARNAANAKCQYVRRIRSIVGIVVVMMTNNHALSNSLALSKFTITITTENLLLLPQHSDPRVVSLALLPHVLPHVLPHHLLHLLSHLLPHVLLIEPMSIQSLEGRLLKHSCGGRW